MTATEASRSFSELLNRVAAGEEFEITRAGATIAVMSPPPPRLLSPTEVRDLLTSLPPTDDQFLDDLRDIRRSVGTSDDPWQS